MNTEPMHQPERIKLLRIAAGLEQQELAHRAGIVKSHMSNIESGKVNPSPRVLGRIASALGCEIADFLPGLAIATRTKAEAA